VNGQTPRRFFPAYIQNYLDREVRTVHGIKDLLKFQEFMQLCAALTGNFFDYETVGSTLSLTRKKIDEWLMVLYSSYIIFFARPYSKSMFKEMKKQPKLYFYDTGLCSSLMRSIKTQEDIENSPKTRGKLFENLVFSEVWKKNFIKGRYLDGSPPRHPVRSTGSPGEFAQSVNDDEEVLHYTSSMQNDDFNGMIMERGDKLKAIEIKSSDKFNPKWFDNMQKHPDLKAADKFVVYTGPTIDVEGGRALNFCDLDQLF
jgi:predicted AAA+ superfamily ATPase